VKEEENKSKAIDMAVSQIEKLFGKGSIMRMGERPIEAIPVVSTGSLSLDIALGVGGLPRGRVIEIFGPEASGKTTLALQAVSETQKLGGTAAFIDAEHALDMAYANKIGVKTDELLISQPDTGEQALEIAEILVRSGGADIVVIDSVAALVPRAEIEGDMGDAHMGLTTTGGNALKFYSSMRLDIRRISSIKDGQDIIGSRTRVKVVKNKLAPPFKEVEFDIIFGEGISKEGDILDLAVDAGIIEKAGTWFSYGDIRIGQGRENAKDYLRKNESVKEDIREKILTQYGLKKGES